MVVPCTTCRRRKIKCQQPRSITADTQPVACELCVKHGFSCSLVHNQDHGDVIESAGGLASSGRPILPRPRKLDNATTSRYSLNGPNTVDRYQSPSSGGYTAYRLGAQVSRFCLSMMEKLRDRLHIHHDTAQPIKDLGTPLKRSCPAPWSSKPSIPTFNVFTA